MVLEIITLAVSVSNVALNFNVVEIKYNQMESSFQGSYLRLRFSGNVIYGGSTLNN